MSTDEERVRNEPFLQAKSERLKGPGRPKKGSTEITLAQLGLTKRQARKARALANLNPELFEDLVANQVSYPAATGIDSNRSRKVLSACLHSSVFWLAYAKAVAHNVPIEMELEDFASLLRQMFAVVKANINQQVRKQMGPDINNR